MANFNILFLFVLLTYSNIIDSKEKNPFHYILIIDNVYQGTYESCEMAFKHRGDVNARCLHEDFIHLPKNFKHRYIDFKQQCLIRRQCNG